MTTDEPASRRRGGPAPRPRSGLTAVTACVFVALSMLAVLLAGSGHPVTESAGGSRGELVTSTLRACPDMRQPGGTSTSIDVGAIASAGDSVKLPGDGVFRFGPLGEQGRVASLSRGSVLSLPTAPASAAPVLRAVGGLAAGLFGFRADTNTDGDTLAVGRCSDPRATWWFTGAGATLDHTSTLVMANVDPGPAVVDVRVLGPNGPVETIATKGITIAPGTRRLIKLTDVAPQGKELSVSVHASRGRVVAAMSDAFAANAADAPGNEWIPDQTAPSRVIRLAGLPAKAGSRTLLVANPSDLETLVDVKVSGKSGSFTPAGLDQLRVAPGAVASVDVTDAVGKGPASLRLRSKLPVAATVRSTSGTDSSYAGVVIPLYDAAVSPVLARATTTVVLSAGEVGARARITAYDADGRKVDEAELALAPTASGSWQPRKGAAYLVVDPEKGTVFGAVSLSGRGTSQVPLVTLPFRLERPAVRPAL